MSSFASSSENVSGRRNQRLVSTATIENSENQHDFFRWVPRPPINADYYDFFSLVLSKTAAHLVRLRSSVG